MGFGVANIYPCPHLQNDAVESSWWRVHDGNIPLDTNSPQVTGDQYRSLRDASGNINDFGDAVAAIGGTFQTWFLALPSAYRENLRKSFGAL